MNRNASNIAMGVGAVAAMALCCLGPILLVTGGLAAVGGFPTSPLAVLAGLGVAGLGVTLLIRRSKAGDRSCCAPTEGEHTEPRTPADPGSRIP